MGPVRLRLKGACTLTRARLGVLETPHGAVETPCLAVTCTANGAQGALPQEMHEAGARLASATTYHLSLRPGAQVVQALGGIHAFLGWNGPIFTDSGAEQACGFFEPEGDTRSLLSGPEVAPARPYELRQRRRGQEARLLKMDDEGLTSTSPFDGARVRLTPVTSLRAQEALGADCVIALHAPVPRSVGSQGAAVALDRTDRWTRLSLSSRARHDQALYGVVQGGSHADAWRESARRAAALPLEGVALGSGTGDLWGEALALLPQSWPRHVSGAADPASLVRCVSAGVDTLDGFAPARLSRQGVFFTSAGLLDITHEEISRDERPIEEGCGCYTCRSAFSRAYLHHLARAGELLGATLASLHNHRFLLRLLENIREALQTGAFPELSRAILSAYDR